MRKTKLIILPTRCLNTVGFLLLFLSCPVIGDWGRIKPDSEMSQWSILIERAGSCGLVRRPPGIKNAITPDGLMECKAPVANLQNNTLTRGNSMESGKGHEKSENLVIPILDVPIQESGLHRRNNGVQTGTEGRLHERQLQRRSFRRETRSLSPRLTSREDRRAVSLDRRHSFRVEENVRRNDRSTAQQRNQHQEVRIAERNDFRLSSPERRVVAGRLSRDRRVRSTDSRIRENVRSNQRLSVTHHEGDVSERRESAMRRIENARSQRTTRERFGQFRNARSEGEERRMTRRVMQDERNEIRRNLQPGRSARQVSFNSRDLRQNREQMERRNQHQERISRRVDNARMENMEGRNSAERRMERRDYREERRSSERRRTSEREALVSRRRDSSEERRLTRETLGRRSVERTDARRLSPEERQIRISDSSLRQVSATRSLGRRATQTRKTERDVRSARRSLPNTAAERIDRTVRDTTEVSRRRDDSSRRDMGRQERSVRLTVTRERSVDDARRNERRYESSQAQIRRIETDLMRKEGGRMSVRRVDKPQDGSGRRDAEGVLARVRDYREKSVRIDGMLQYDRMEPFTLKQKMDGFDKYQSREFLDGIKKWFGQKNQEEGWVAKYGELTTTCLVGAAVYLLTTRQVKSV